MCFQLYATQAWNASHHFDVDLYSAHLLGLGVGVGIGVGTGWGTGPDPPTINSDLKPHIVYYVFSYINIEIQIILYYSKLKI